MKIVYTHSEAITLLTNRAIDDNDIGGAVTVEIEPVGSTPAPVNALEQYAKVVAEFGLARFNVNKIPAIKQLRTLIPGLGLAEAKNVIEANTETVLTYYSRTQNFSGFNLGSR